MFFFFWKKGNIYSHLIVLLFTMILFLSVHSKHQKMRISYTASLPPFNMFNRYKLISFHYIFIFCFSNGKDNRMSNFKPCFHKGIFVIKLIFHNWICVFMLLVVRDFCKKSDTNKCKHTLFYTRMFQLLIPFHYEIFDFFKVEIFHFLYLSLSINFWMVVMSMTKN